MKRMPVSLADIKSFNFTIIAAAMPGQSSGQAQPKGAEMAASDKLVNLSNVQLAWKWVRSNPSPAYKNYFRTLYANFASAESGLIAGLQDRLKRGVFRPAHACKLYLPKASGGLRSYTLLTVEDQIVYQAFVNVIAGLFYPEIRNMYMGQVFSHMYAGPTSPFFYQDWRIGFAGFNAAARKAFRDGLRFTAHFDLTACYDSIDHNVLRHFLESIGCDTDFCRRFTILLSHWTSTGLRPLARIYQGHGIPQGPLSSGLVAELVLHHFDQHRKIIPGVRYLRYVDDIRLFARTEQEIRTAVYNLDTLSKEIGLFPQTAKISIHEVSDIEDELKSLSRPDDDDFDWSNVEDDQNRLHGLLAELSPKFRVRDVTRFTYLLSKAVPRASTNARLWKVMERHPELYGHVLSYFNRYRRLPKNDGVRLVNELRKEEIHGVIIASLVKTAEGRLSHDRLLEVDEVVKKHWKKKMKLSPDLAAVLGRWCMTRELIGAEQVERILKESPGWYTRAELATALDSRILPQPRLNTALYALLEDTASDVSIAAAVHLGLQETLVDAATSMHVSAHPVLSAFGVLSGDAKRACGIRLAFERLLGHNPPSVDWKQLFGRTYRQAEKQAVRWSGYLVDATAWVNCTDVFCDWLLDAVYRADTTLGTYKLGGIGSVLTPGSRFQRQHPHVFNFVNCIHGKRGESDLTHAKKRVGSTYIKPTSFIPFAFFKTAKKLAESALNELAARWPLPVSTRRATRPRPNAP